MGAIGQNMHRGYLERIWNAQYGTDRPFKVNYFDNGKLQFNQFFPTNHIAWANGENWKSIRPSSSNKSYSIDDIREQ